VPPTAILPGEYWAAVLILFVPATARILAQLFTLPDILDRLNDA